MGGYRGMSGYWNEYGLCFKMLISFFKKVFSDNKQNILNFGLGCSSPLYIKKAQTCVREWIVKMAAGKP